MAYVEEIRTVVDDFYDACLHAGKEDGALPDYLVKALRSLEMCLADVLKVMVQCKAKRKRDYLKMIASRSQLTTAVDKCGRDIQRTLSLLNTRLSLYQSSTVNDISVAINTFVEAASAPKPPPPPVLRRPQIFFGRDIEVNDVVTRLVQKAPARIAILGPGGIGKTSIALSALHDVQEQGHYKDACYFVPCDAVVSADDLLAKLAQTLGMVIKGTDMSIEAKVIAYIRSLTCILCLDNFEIPWDAQTVEVEELLAKLTSLPTVGVIITLRGTEYPASTLWTKSPLDVIKPLDFDSAMQTFETISDKSDDYTAKLVEAVDCIPLAVNLLAHLAQIETTASLWKRWEKVHTSMIKRRDRNRATNLDYSIMLSLESPRMSANPSAVSLLSILSMLPDGVQSLRLPDFQDAYDGKIDVVDALTTLKQNALVYVSVDDRLCVLSPIRFSVQASVIPSPDLVQVLEDYYVALAAQEEENTYVNRRMTLLPEVGNIHSVFPYFLSHSDDQEKVIKTIVKFSQSCQNLGVYDTTLLALATPLAKKFGLKIYANCIHTWGFMSLCAFNFDVALVKLNEAFTLHIENQDIKQQAIDLFSIGRVYRFQSKLDEAQEVLKQAMDCYAQVDNTLGRAYCLNELACIYRPIGKLSEAKEALEEALKLHEKNNDPLGQANDLQSLGELYLQLGDLDSAELNLNSALKLHIQVDDILGQAYDLHYIGSVYKHQSQLDKAESMTKEAQMLHIKSNDLLGQGNDLSQLGQIYSLQSQYDKAKKMWDEALEIYQKLDNEHSQANILYHLGSDQLNHSELEEAQKNLSQALSIFESSDKGMLGKANCFQKMGEINLRKSELEAARANADAALELHIKIGDQYGHGSDLRLIGEIDMRQNELDNAWKRFEEALEIQEKSHDLRGKAYSVYMMAHVYKYRIQLTQAEQKYTEAAELFVQAHDRLGQANAMQGLGVVYKLLQKLQKAEEVVKNACQLHVTTGHILGQAYSLSELGDIYMLLHKTSEAETCYHQAFELHSKANDLIGKGNVIHSLAQIHLQRSELNKAEIKFKEALLIHEESGNLMGQANVWVYIGQLHGGRHEMEKARDAYECALRLHRQTGDIIGQGNALQRLGILNTQLGNFESAENFLNSALKFHTEAQEPLGQANDLQKLGKLKARMSKLDQAEANYTKALDMYKQMNDPLGQGNTTFEFGLLHTLRNQGQEAYDCFLKAHDFHSAAKDILGQANDLQRMGQVLLYGLAKPQEAAEKLEEAFKLHTLTGIVPDQLTDLRVMGKAYTQFRDFENSIRVLEKALQMDTELGNVKDQAADMQLLGFAHLQNTQLDQALEYFNKALPLQEVHGTLVDVFQCLFYRGATQWDRGALEEAQEDLFIAIEKCKGAGSVPGQLQVLNLLKTCYTAAGMTDKVETVENSIKALNESPAALPEPVTTTAPPENTPEAEVSTDAPTETAPRAESPVPAS
ncbi:TPR-like protein [Artomyces pyxidatus]|uniref:TPR-like protein n=1 Tax=Artomyces pyxidatus TaxID=48021 RepID=A0ACB8SPN7_9AGAM|nr:TPR-like protein [Artomyces pyxidatus]